MTTPRRRSAATKPGRTARQRRAKSTKSTAPPGLQKSTSAAPAKDPDPTQPAGFVATPKQIAYLFALREAVANGGDGQTSDSAIERKMKLSRRTIYEWKKDPLFVAWYMREMLGERDMDWELILAKHTQQAIRGSVRSAEFVGRVRSVGMKGGGFTDSPDVDNSVQNYTVISLVPRPPALPSAAGGSEQ